MFSIFTYIMSRVTHSYGQDGVENRDKAYPNTSGRRKARENACEPLAIGFGFTFDKDKMGTWLKFFT